LHVHFLSCGIADQDGSDSEIEVRRATPSPTKNKVVVDGEQTGHAGPDRQAAGEKKSVETDAGLRGRLNSKNVTSATILGKRGVGR
jgi:hypothetical protein